MAAPTDENVTVKKCILHHESVKNERLQGFTKRRWQTFKECAKQWRNLDGPNRIIADDVANLIDKEYGDSTLPSDIGFHSACYRRFTDKFRILEGVKRKAKASTIPPEAESSQPVQFTAPSPKTLRSKSEFMKSATSSTTTTRSSTSTKSTSSSSRVKSKSVLPAVCIICKKKDKMIMDRFTRNRKMDKLSKSETATAGSLLKAAELKKDESILRHIRGQDCVAIEVCYHRRCFVDYTRFLRVSKAPDPQMYKYNKAYKIFSKEIIQKRIIDSKEILRMKKLHDLFVKLVEKHEMVDPSGYRTESLKSRIKRDFPQLQFHIPYNRTRSEMVYTEDLEASSLIDILPTSTSASTESENGTSNTTETETELVNRPIAIEIDSLRFLHNAGLIIQNAIKDSPSMPSLWPPTSEDINLDVVKKIVPVVLYNFLSLCMGFSDDMNMDDFVEQNRENELKLFSICQDLIYLASSGKRQTPKSLSLALTTKHVTGSERLVTVLNRLGHSSSIDTVRSLETALAQLELQLQCDIPRGFNGGVSTTLVWDNIDFGEETLSGHGTTHHTNGIMIQKEINLSPPARTVTMKKHVRTLEIQQNVLPEFVMHSRKGPKNLESCDQFGDDYFEYCLLRGRKLDFAYILCKFEDEDVCSIPSWKGFNIALQADGILNKSAIYYLPVIPSSPTDMATVNMIFERSLEMKERLNLNHIVLVFDQAIYSKAQQIRWKSDDLLKKTVIRLGEFHTCMSFLGIIGKRFGDAGLKDILIESQVVALGSVETVLNGHHYNRSIRAHKLMFEALSLLRLNMFLDSVPDPEKITVEARNIWLAYPDKSFEEVVNSNAFEGIMHLYDKFVQDNNQINPTFSFWSSYLDMVQTLLLFLRATRESKWNTHLAAIKFMMPWYFAYDRMNYARYLPAYWLEMMNLPKTHPECYQEMLVKGNWTVQRQDTHAFASVGCDQAIEQTCNRDSKCKGGIVGITMNQAATQRWILSQPQRAAMARELEDMAGMLAKESGGEEKSKRIKDRNAVNSIIATIGSMIHPFEPNDQLVALSNGAVATDALKCDLLSAKEKGEVAVESFIHERLVSHKADIFEPIKNMKLKTFSDQRNLKLSKTKSVRETVIKYDRQFFGRLLIIAQTRNVDLKEILTYSLGPVSYPLSNCDGTLSKTNKSALLEMIEGEVKDSDCYVQSVPENSALIIDGMAVIQSLKTIPSSFGELSDAILTQIIGLAKLFKCSRLDFVTDRYPMISIKNLERTRRSCPDTQLIRIYSKEQKTPSQWRKYLSSGQNKEALIQFIFKTWCESDLSSVGRDLEIFMTHGEKCHNIITNSCVTDLSDCDHEEADTRMFLHAHHASTVSLCKNIIINSPDTDVAVLALSMQQFLDSNIFFVTGSKNKRRILDIKKMAKELGSNLTCALIGLHVFTGCDTTSAFYGKGKKKAFQLAKETEDFLDAFSNLGETFHHVREETVQILERFVCELYGQKLKNVNEARYKIFCINSTSEQNMPPTHDALVQHIMRVNFQCAIYNHSISKKINSPSPNGNGWIIKDNNISVCWMTKNPAPDTILEAVACGCRVGKCSSKRCGCKSSKLSCTDFCKCKECENDKQTETEKNIMNLEPEESDIDDD